MKTFAERLEQLIRQHGVTMQGLAKGLGVSRQTLYNWLHNDRITQKNLHLLADYFDVSAHWLRYGAAEQDEAPFPTAALAGKRKNLIDNIVRNERVLQLAIDSSALTIWEYDLLKEKIKWAGAGDCMACLNPMGQTKHLEQLLLRIHVADRDDFFLAISRIIEEGGTDVREMRVVASDGALMWCVATTSQQLDATSRPCGLVGTFRDIHQERLAQEALRQSESRFHSIFENTPVPLWEEDFSGVRGVFERLRQMGVTDLEHYLHEHPDFVRECVSDVHIIDVNQAAVEMHRAADKEELLQNLHRTFVEASYTAFARELVALWQGELRFHTAAVVCSLDGEERPVDVLWTIEPGCEESWVRVIVSIIPR